MADKNNIPETLLNQFGDGAKLVMEKMKEFGLHLVDSSGELGSHLISQNGKLSTEAMDKLGDFAGQAQEFITKMMGKHQGGAGKTPEDGTPKH